MLATCLLWELASVISRRGTSRWFTNTCGRFRDRTKEKTMTVCIAALCEEPKALVVAAERMVRSTRCGSEAEFLKISRLHKDWWLMPAGDDVGPALSLYLLSALTHGHPHRTQTRPSATPRRTYFIAYAGCLTSASAGH